MANHEAVAALPVSGDADKAALRALLTRRFAYCLTASESATSLVAADPATGVVPLYLIQNSTMFAYDSTDGTTAHDGVTCLVSSDGKRFKSGTIASPYSVLDKDTTAQPASPAVGDRYLVPTAATGTDWAGKDGKIAIYTAAGWRFAISPIGRFLYVEDETAFYHRNAAGTWTAGVGSIALGANSVNISNVLGANASFVIKVENQTTNAPPASPVAPVAYIIGPSPTGAWSGHAGKLAICLVNGAFTIIAPATGDVVFDKALAAPYQFNGTTWVSSLGAWLRFTASSLVTSGSTSTGGSGPGSYSATVAPTTATAYVLDSGTALTYTALKTAATLRIKYRATIFANANVMIALYKDSDAAALDWSYSGNLTTSNSGFVSFIVSAADTSSHTYKIRIQKLDTGADPAINRRQLTIEESA